MKYTIESFKEKFNISASEVVRFLGDLKENVPNEDFGICCNLSSLIEDINGDLRLMGYDIVEEFSVGWRHHTGRHLHPVPPLHYKMGNRWKGEQLEYRLDLIDHIIKQLKED